MAQNAPILSKGIRKRKLLSGLVSLLIGLQSLFVFPAVVEAAAASQFGVSAMNTTAGYAGLASTSVISAGKTVRFSLEQPDGEQLSFTKESKEVGPLLAEIDAKYLEQAGVYLLSAAMDGVRIEPTSFIVRAAKVDLEQSTLEVNEKKVALGDAGRVIAMLQDQFGNPVSDHKLRLISARANDQISAPYNPGGLTNEEGIVIFEVRAREAGSATFSLIDLSNDLVLPHKASLVFSGANAWGGNPFALRVAQAQNGGDFFIISGVPDRVTVGSPFSVSVEAVDENSQTITDYSGKIRFSSTDLQADVPADYTFTPADIGEKRFDLAITFNTPGQQELVVTDASYEAMKGTIQLNVVSPGAEQPAATGAPAAPQITSPQNDFMTKDANVVITGVSGPLLIVSIFDGLRKLDEVQSSPQGEFNFDARRLAEGAHDFSVAVTTAEGQIVTSDPVRVIIDQTGPSIRALRFEPEQPGADENMIVLIQSEQNLSISRIEINQQLVSLEPAREVGVDWYKANLNSPVNTGNYPVTIELADNVGNRAKFDNYRTLTVAGAGAPLKPAAPSATLQLAAQRDDARVLFSWSKATDPAVVAYNIMQSVAPTAGFTKINALPITNNSYLLDQQTQPETRYYRVLGIDSAGNEVALSDVIQVAGYGVGVGVGVGGPAAGLLLPSITAAPETGPEAWLIALLGIFLGVMTLSFRKRLG